MEVHLHCSVLLEDTSLWGLRLFLLLVASVSIGNALPLFVQGHGWSHRIAGAILLSWLAFGVFKISDSTVDRFFWLFYDVILGLLGITATLTAARDFPHAHVKNAPGQSGTLEQRAIVTQSEMIEHSFYQGLNLAQALYLHCAGYFHWEEWYIRLAMLWLVTCPWLFRSCFPVHSFSNNWKFSTNQNKWTVEMILYRIKKWQYVFYKHFVWTGVNVSVALNTNANDQNIVSTTSWRIFWLALNTSYVMEFFLQSLVKRGMLSQGGMLWMQRLLMTASSIAALVGVMPHLHLGVCVVSVLLNFYHRGHDVLYTMLIAGLAMSRTTPSKDLLPK